MPQSMEIVFPRGGKQRTGKPKFKSGKSEDLFKTEVESDAPPRKKRKKRSNESEAIKVNEVVVQNLSLQSIAEGMVLLGCVMEIEDYSLKISLPGRLYGTVPIVNISDNYTQLIKAFADNPGSVDEVATLQSLFRVGQTFPCKVMSTKANSSKSRRNQITISINPRHVNEGLRPASIMDGMHLFCAVQSIEDHGYVVDIGINGCPAFLSHDSMLEYVRYHNDGHSLSIGHIVPAVVNMPDLLEGKLHSGQVVALIANPTVVMKSKIKVSRDISLNVLTPGTVVDSVIEKVSESGLVVDCLGFPGCVHKNHMKKSFLQHSNCIKGLTAGGIVLYVHPITRVIHITMHSKPNPKKLSKMFGGLKRWSVVDDAIITEVHKHFIFLKLKGSVQGIAWEKELSDEPVQNVIKTFNVNDTVQCRVIALHYLDNMVSVSLKKSVLNQTYVSREDLRTGAVYEGKVKKLVPGGMVVTLSPGVQGFVRDIYMADVPIRKPEVMFPKGKEVKCKVLHIDRTSSPPSILLTCKKGMLQTKLPILSSYQDASPGLVTKGTIVNIKDSGLVLSFLNKVQGWVPSSELGAYKIQDPEKVFFRGQVVKCRVLNCYPEEEKLFLSLRIDNSKLFGNKDMSKEKFAVGTVVEVKINKKTEKGLDVVVKGTKFQAFLPVGHLSDHVENCQKLLETYKEKDVIDVLCFSSKGVPIVTRKSSLLKVAANGVFHSQISDFKDQTVLPVVVKHFARYGMFVELGYNIRGLVPNKFLADRKILKPEEAGYVINQTLLARVIKVDTESNRIELSTKMMDIYHQEYNYGLDLLQSYFGDVSKMKEYYLTLDNTKSKLARMAVGSVVLARVTSVTEIGVLCELHDGLKGFVTNHHCNNEVMKENEERHGVVLYIDMENERIELSFSPQLVRNVSKAKVHESCKVRIDQVIKCEVLVIKKELVLVSLGGHAVGKFAYLPARRALNDLVGRQDLYTIGQHYHIVIMRIFDSSIVLGVLKQHVKYLQTNDTEKESALKRKNNKVDAPAKRQKKMQKGCSLNIHEQEFDNSNQNLVCLQSAEVHEVVCKSQSALTTPSVKPAVPEKQNHVEAVGDQFPSENSELVVGDKYVAVIKKIKEFQMDIVINGKIAVENPELQSPFIKTFPRLQVSKGFNFDAHTVAVDLKILAQSFPDSSDDNQEQDEKKHKRDDVLNEKDIFERENLLIDKNQLPGTADEFEELVKGSPNMAALWVRYMVFHLEQMDIDSARNIAERALKTISFREEEEKLKIWIAFLNLENLYGTQESLQEVFERALPLNEPSKLYNAMVDIYFRSNKVAEAENMYHIMVKKFHLNKEVWISFGLFYMKTGRPELARKVMDRSLKSLDQKHHIDIIGKFAEMEFKHGDVELGKTMFDGVLKNYPKRTDLWSIYIDLFIKFGDLSGVRKLFERVTSMKLSARKMKFFFKRYLAFEHQHGTAESCDDIARKASDYFKS